jgi:ribonuclease HII
VEIIAGVDEAGRGPLAGPVVAAAVILPENHGLEGLRDSKKLSPKRREEIYSQIQASASTIGIGIVHETEIDRTNILSATHKSMQQALGRLKIRPDKALIDGYELPNQIIKNRGIINGDSQVDEIMAASIVAKVTRDRLMVQYDRVFPDYGFAKHKGYGTLLHMEMLRSKKATPIHRKTFKPVTENIPSLSWLRNKRLIGKVGEQLAACHLIRGDYELIKLNEYCHPYGEIDIIAVQDNTLVFAEVKTQSREQTLNPEIKVDETKMKKLEDAISVYLIKNEYNGDIRLDVLSVLLGKGRADIRHYKGVEFS